MRRQALALAEQFPERQFLLWQTLNNDPEVKPERDPEFSVRSTEDSVGYTHISRFAASA